MTSNIYSNLTGGDLEEELVEEIEQAEVLEEEEEEVKQNLVTGETVNQVEMEVTEVVEDDFTDFADVEEIVEEPLKLATDIVDSPREMRRTPATISYSVEEPVEEEEEAIVEAIYVAPAVKRTEQKHAKSLLNDNLLFKGDDFLASQLSPSLYSLNNDTLAIPLEEKDLYKTKVNVENIEHVIKRAFAANTRRVSFSLEELGLHNRLIEMGVPQDLESFILVRTEKGNVVVHKTATSRTDIESVLMSEAEKCLINGQRIVLPLLETYKFRDKLGIVSERYRYRASLAEIKNFVARTGMKATITKDSFLVVYE